jgi:poly-gamma-glutamate synthesis protein (capsule biosynthesis protein)
MSHVDFSGANRTGELVVHADQVLRLLKVFARVHEERFPIARMERVDVFGGSDDTSMEANNTSAFNCRRVTGGTAWSEHTAGPSTSTRCRTPMSVVPRCSPKPAAPISIAATGVPA